MTSAQDVAKLRTVTGAGVMDCKKALEESNGDFDKAQKILASNAQSIAQKKAERAANQGLIETYNHASKIGVVLEIACESDFVAKNDEFKDLAHNIAMQIASINPKDLPELLEGSYIKDDSLTIKDLIDQATAKIGENIKVKRFIRYELGEEL
ncbi:MAG: translation elongation factor Ts [Patescibacteria group bacterium]|jgi:elongation factor Ts